MMIDGYSYDRLGFKISGNFGTPSGYKPTAATPWSNTAAKPVTDILTFAQFAASDRGEVYNRIELPTADLMDALNTDEVKQLISGLVNSPLATTAFNVRDPRMTNFFSQLINMTVITEDKTYVVKAPDNTEVTSRVLPLHNIVFSNTADDNSNAYDFAQGILAEPLVAGFVGQGGIAGGERRGPLGYFTAPVDLDPPTLVAHAVDRGFPRKHRPTAVAAMYVA